MRILRTVLASGLILALCGAPALAQTTYRLTDLGTLGGMHSEGVAINASGQVTGFAWLANGDSHAFLWDGTAMQDLGTLGGTTSQGEAINASGQVTGFARVADGDSHAFLWDGTAMQDLGTLGGTTSGGVDINASGQVTGNAYIANGAQHAFLWDGTAMRDLGTLGGTYSNRQAINASGQVTGGSTFNDDPSQPYHAFLWDGTAMRDLNALIDPSDPLQPYVTLLYGQDINDDGQIVAQGIDSRTGYIRHAYLVSPVGGSDTTPPEVIITTPSNGATYLQNATVLASYTCEDDLSGIATCQGDVANGAPVPTSVLGPQTFTVTATDLVGNSKVKSVGYQVVDELPEPSTSLLLSPFGAVSFGDVAVGAKRVRRFRLQNMSKGVLPIASIVTYGPNKAMFTIAHDCGASLAGWANCTIVVTFRPTSPGAKSATLRLTTGNGLLRYRPLSGNGL